MSYTNVFGGYNINTAFPSYMSYILDADLQLNWASSFVDTAPGVNNVTAQINDLNPLVDNLTVTLADATLISVGQTIQFNNVGANTITINDFSGGELAVIPTFDNNQYILYLQDNSTQAGTWGITHLGAGTSSADAVALAGLGTVALNSQINTNFPGKTIAGNYQVLLSDRASILVWTGGTGTITLPNQLAGFYIAVNNEGSGVINIATPDGTTIDGQVSFPLNPSESSYFIGVNANWNTLGFGVESYFQVNVLSPLDLSAVNPSRTLTNAEASRLVQQYTGTLANNVTVYYPAAAGQWYIWNNTMGPYSVTAQLAGPTGNPVIVPQGEKLILYSDGTSIYSTPTVASSAIFPDGTAGAPGINFISDNTTGFYKPATPPAGVVNYSAAGTASLSFGGAAAGYGLGILGGLPGIYYNAANSHYVGFRAGALAANTTWTLPLTDSAGTQALVSNGAGVLSWSNINPGTVTSVSGTANEITVVNGTTTPVISISATYAGQDSITTVGTIDTGTWNADVIDVSFGGTGIDTTTAYGVLCGGTTATNPFQNVGTGTLNYVLSSQGAAALPNYQRFMGRYVGTATAANSASLSIGGLNTSASGFVILFNSLVPAIDDVNLWTRFGTGALNTGNTYNWINQYSGYNSIASTVLGSLSASAIVSSTANRTFGITGVAFINMQGYFSSQIQGWVSGLGNSGTQVFMTMFQGTYGGARPDTVGVLMSAGNILSGSITVYEML